MPNAPVARFASTWLWCVLLCVFPSAPAFAQGEAGADEPFLHIPEKAHVLDDLRHEHPRLLLGEGGFEAIRAAADKDELLGQWREDIVGAARKMLDQPPSEYVIPDGKRLLATSRRVFDRVTTLGLAFGLTGETEFAERAWAELETAAAFKDWNPSHFLDTSEMTAAFGIGYDWLYDVWTDEQRERLIDAIVTHGLEPGLNSYRGKEGYGWWVKAHHNWNQVCNGGLAIGALAIADEEPELAAEILHSGLVSLRLAMRSFAPDGGWAEGPSYWDYATRYNVFHLAALETALGSSFGFTDFPGFAQTGEDPIYLSGATEISFNFADGHARVTRAPQMFWLARRFDRPDYADWERRRASPNVFDLVWAARMPRVRHDFLTPLDRFFAGLDVITMRSAWHEKIASFVGIKAGSNAVNHSHLDLGSFVFEALGERWAIDLGSDDYNMPAYFGNRRWTYYRLRAEGHNTLVLNPGQGPDQDSSARARFTSHEFATQQAGIDLTPACAKAAPGTHVARQFSLVNDRRDLVVQDQIEPGDEPVDAWWFMHTPAAIEADGAGAVLTIGDRRLRVQIEQPEGAEFVVMDARPLDTSPNPSMQNANKGIRKLAIHLKISEPTSIVVRLSPIR